MSGIGKHKYSHEASHVYGESIAICPYCENEKCYADFVDVGVGLVQCGPYYCQECDASEIGRCDDPRELTDEEKEKGWYKPGADFGSSVNTVNGNYVDHKTAKTMYEFGILDEK